jgi:predicted ArsR family transcriptional regulator
MVEQRINAWLKQAEPDVKMMEQVVDTEGRLTISFLYDEGFMATEQRLTEEAAAIVESALREEPVLEPLKVDQEQV